MEQERKWEIREASGKWLIRIGIIGLILVAINILIMGPVIYSTTGYEYRERVGSHFDNAVSASTFEEMKTELEIAVEHLHDEGVDDLDYNCLAFRTSHDQMDYWFDQIDGILYRLNESIYWFNNNLTDNNTEEYADVYGSKLENIRLNLREILNIDDDGISIGNPFKSAWYIENHIFFHLLTWWTWWSGFIISLIILISGKLLYG